MSMSTIQEERILSALKQAQSVGIVEESLEVCGTHITLRNLVPEEYEQILAESSDKKDASFLYSFQLGHICRAVVEINDMDLRNIDFIETKLPSGKMVKLERHEWLRDKIFSTWSRESLAVLYRKFVDVLSKAEEVANKGVVFNVQDEKPDDKLRRLLGEVKELQQDLPVEAVAHILDDFGLTLKSVEDTTALEHMDKTAKAISQQDLVKAMQDPATLKQVTQPPVEQPKAPPVEQQLPTTQVVQKKEPPVQQTGTEKPADAVYLGNPEDRDVVLETPQNASIDPNAAKSILDQPPVVGVNPMFKPHRK